MSTPARNLSLFWIAVIGAVITSGSVILQVGEIKGILQNTITNHDREIRQLNTDVRAHDTIINDLRRGQSVLESRMISSANKKAQSTD
jgi:hypothetical protein